ncbi:MAG: ATP-dependent DNA ligase [Actinobacteria bacterium]|nr:ATP-dependent DNA ligase [Actinomycetota bacterium]
MTADPLATYRQKRDFDRTSEPAGTTPGGPGERRFVVQRHRARRLHYDLRLEIDGVLVSWAVPKGPTLDPNERRLAVHVEDHPIEYRDFEGVIPRGEYGAGDVIVWDQGTWTPAKTDDPAAAVASGELHADLCGEKLRGRFVLVRRGDGRDWMLLHKNDDHAVVGWDPEDHLESVVSGRTNDEVGLGEAPEPTLSSCRWSGPTDDELAALDALGAGGSWEVGGREVRLSNLDKVLFPGADGRAPVTKRELIRYYTLVAPTVLPYLTGRPLNVHRAPGGVDGTAFWQKAVPAHAPEWVTRWRHIDARPGKTAEYVVADSVATMAWLANEAAIELHPWTSTCADPQRPSWALIDIDPGTASSFDDVVVLAQLFRTVLDHVGMEGRPKVTGQRGIQIWVPIAQDPSFDDTQAWVEAISRAVGGATPELVSWKWRVEERGGLARLDYTQNAINKTLVAPYSVRLRNGAPVSVPLEWEELDDLDLRPDRWDLRTVLDRLAEVGDPFRPLLNLAQPLRPL